MFLNMADRPFGIRGKTNKDFTALKSSPLGHLNQHLRGTNNITWSILKYRTITNTLAELFQLLNYLKIQFTCPD